MGVGGDERVGGACKGPFGAPVSRPADGVVMGLACRRKQQ